MRIYTNTDFTGHYPVGTSAVVIADTPGEAAFHLNLTLREAGLRGDAVDKDMIEVPFVKGVKILTDGNY